MSDPHITTPIVFSPANERAKADSIATAIARFVEGNAASRAVVAGILFAALRYWPPH